MSGMIIALGVIASGPKQSQGSWGAARRPLDRHVALRAPRDDGLAPAPRASVIARRAAPWRSRVVSPPLSVTRLSLSSSAMKRPYVTIMASRRNGTLYVGVTSDIARWAAQHREGEIAGFTRRYELYT